MHGPVVEGVEMSLNNGLALERELQNQLFAMEITKEGFAAYVEKRKPVWKKNRPGCGGGRAGSRPSPFSSRAALVPPMASVLRSDLADGVLTTTLSRPDSRKAVATKERRKGGLNRIAQVIWHAQKPVVARVNGQATGAGMDLVLVCDLAYATDQARFRGA
jgi:enoyl-CoA hydratase/carnithine racemase